MNTPLPADQLALLAGCPLFSGCDPAVIHRVLSDCECTAAEFSPGQVLYQPHQFSRSLGIVLTGSVRVTRDALLISTLSPGELFGAAALFNDHSDYATTLTARSPCRVVFLTQELVCALMDENPVIRNNYIRYLSGRIRFLSGKVQSLAAAGVCGKLTRFLLTRLTPENPVLDCPPTELARRLGISRASLYRAFEALEARGLIVRKGRTLRATDLAALESCSL